MARKQIEFPVPPLRLTPEEVIEAVLNQDAGDRDRQLTRLIMTAIANYECEDAFRRMRAQVLKVLTQPEK